MALLSLDNLLKMVFSHSFKALNPTNKYCLAFKAGSNPVKFSANTQ